MAKLPQVDFINDEYDRNLAEWRLEQSARMVLTAAAMIGFIGMVAFVVLKITGAL